MTLGTSDPSSTGGLFGTKEWVQFTLLKLHISRAVLSLGIPLIFCDADVAWLADARRALTHANQPSNPRPSLRFSSEVRYWETPPGRSANTGVYSALPDPGAIRVFSRAIERSREYMDGVDTGSSALPRFGDQDLVVAALADLRDVRFELLDPFEFASACLLQHTRQRLAVTAKTFHATCARGAENKTLSLKHHGAWVLGSCA